ncbi:hypothetical protein Tco_0112060 [Tanacetum coccineum]
MSDTLNNLVPEITVAKTNEFIKEAVLRMIHIKITVLNVYPTTSTSTATTITTDLQHQLYLMMKSNLQDQADDPELILNEPPRYMYNKDLFFLKYENFEERKYVLSLHKIHDVPFLEEDLEEKINCWIRKEFKTFNEEAQLSI